MSKIAWCTGHYKTSFTKEKAKELRSRGYKVSFGSYIKSEGESYCKIYLEKDFNYHVLNILNSIEARVNGSKFSGREAILSQREKIKEIAMDYKKDIGIEIDRLNNTSFKVVAVICNGEYELESNELKGSVL